MMTTHYKRDEGRMGQEWQVNTAGVGVVAGSAVNERCHPELN